MKQSLIKKDISSFKIPPNLENYEKIRKSFSWEKAKSQIEYKNNKLNAAYNAIERNAQNWRKNKIALYWIGAENQKEKYTFSELIYEIAKIKTIERINFTTSHPAEFNDDLIMVFANEPKLTNSIHLPIQSR